MKASGSTGQPKGVSVSHQSVTQSLMAHETLIPRFSRFLQFASPTFDVSMFEIFFPWYRGATVVCSDRNQLVTNLVHFINEYGIDAAELTPSVVGSLLGRRDEVPGLKILLTIGESLTRYIVDEFGGNDERSNMLYGMYGPTEAAIHCTAYTEFQKGQKVGLIGKPLSTVSAFIASEENFSNARPDLLSILPLGMLGELVIGGHQLAGGYLNRVESTQKVFVENTIHGRLYRTGDKARMLPSGLVEFLGRIESGQVKLRGQRVELGEIENTAMRAQECRSAFAKVIRGNLVLFCLSNSEDFTLTRTRTIEKCAAWLPEHMVPGDVVILHDIPRLPSGKIDKNGLESSYVQHQSDAQVHRALPDGRAERVRKIVEVIMGHEMNDCSDLRHLGLDSLSSIRLASRLRSEGFEISPREALKAGTCEAIAAAMRMVDARSSHYDANNIIDSISRFSQALDALPSLRNDQYVVENAYKSTSLQSALLTETAKNSRAYCNWIELEVSCKDANLDAIENAFNVLALKNSVLRSGFVLEDSNTAEWLQVVWRELDPSQIRVVKAIEHDFEINEVRDFLRPLRIQILGGVRPVKVLLQIHHALYDGWSIDLLVRDLNTYLEDSCVPSRPDFRRVNYFHNIEVTDEIKDQARDHWEHQLTDFEPIQVPNLTGQSTFDPLLTSQYFRLDRRFISVAKTSNIPKTPQILFQAALAQLLGLYLGSEDVVFGLVTSGRTIPVAGIEDIIGPCLAIVPVRVDVHPQKEGNLLLNELEEIQDSVLMFGGVLPLAEIQRIGDISPGRSLFDVLFVWQESLESRESGPSNVAVVKSQDHLEYNMVLEFEPTTIGINLTIRYRQSLLPSSQAAIFVRQLEHITHSLVTSPGSPIATTYSMLNQLMSAENVLPTSLVPESSLSSWVEKYADSHPQRLAVSMTESSQGKLVQGRQLTYTELDFRSNKLAHKLKSLSVAPNDLVCIFMEKSTDLYVSILAAVKAGAGYLPITVQTPAERIRHILIQTEIRVCLRRSSSPDTAHITDSLLTVDVDRPDELTHCSDGRICQEFVGSHVVYSMFTSGSTGVPKGIQVTQTNLASNLEVLKDLYPLPPNSRMLQSSSPAFDLSAFEVFFAWRTGMCLCSAENDVLFKNIEGCIRNMRITHLSLTPTVAALIDPSNVPSVDFLVTAGEAVTNNVFQTWAGKGLFIGYGPSETTNICSVAPNVSNLHAINNVGPPLKNTSAFVVRPDTDAFTILPRGAIGELVVGGDQVYRGYLNAPELTAKCVIDHHEFGRLYRSGDLGRILYDGSIIVSGRLDHQVKIRGQRIELGEISSAIMKTGAVNECAVIVDTGSSETSSILAFWVSETEKGGSESSQMVLREGTKAVTRNIFEALRVLLPSYMIPKALVRITTIPRTEQDKVDNRSLQALWKHASARTREAFTPEAECEDDEMSWTQLERQVAAAISTKLNVSISRLGRRTSLYTLGLDSVSAISLSTEIERTTGRTVEISTVLRSASVAGLAHQITNKPYKIHTSSIDSDNVFVRDTVKSLQKAVTALGFSIESVRPCTPLQEGMLSAIPGLSTEDYFHHTLFELHVEATSVIRVFENLCERHDALRTCFLPTDHPRFSFAQIVVDHCKLPVRTVEKDTLGDLRDLTLVCEQHKPESVHHRPPVSLTVIKHRSKSWLLLCMHHALYDAEAMHELLHQAERLLCGQSVPEPKSFKPVLDKMLSLDLNQADKFWDRMLQDYEPTPFPKLEKGRALETKSSSISRSLSLKLKELNQAARDAHVTLQSLLQAALAKTLSALLGEFDICFGNVVSGRSIAVDSLNMERLVAPCFNTVPLRTEQLPDVSNRTLLKELQRINADSLRYQFSPLRRIQSRCSLNNQRLFDTLFLLQKGHPGLNSEIWTLESELGDMGVSSAPRGSENASENPAVSNSLGICS